MQATEDPPVESGHRPGSPASTGSTGAPTAVGGGAGPRWGRELSAMTVALAALAAGVYRVWDRAWSTPFVHGGDAMAHLALLETVGWTGTPAPNPGLGAPHGVDWVDMPTGADRLHLVVLRGLRALTGDVVVAANLYLLVAIVAVGLAAFVVLRRLHCSPLASGVAAAVFAVAPAQFARAGVGHLFLANYVAVPIAVWLALWASDATGPRRPGWRGGVAPAVLILVLGSASAYYAVFGVVAIAAVGVLRAVRRGAWGPLWRPLVVAAGTVGVVVVNVAGEAARRGGDAGVRVPLDSDSFGLRVAQMLLPVRDHRIPALAGWADGAYRVAAPGDRGAPLGLLATFGLLAIVVWCVRHVGRSGRSGDGLLVGGVAGRDGVLVRLGAIAGSVLAVAAVGGLGMVLATLGFTQIRAWSRMAILVGFVGVAGLAMLWDGVVRRRSPGAPVQWAAAVLLVGVAVFDQLGTSVLPPPAYSEARWRTDRELAGALQDALPDGAMVFQLPVGTFPAELPLGSISANDLLGPQVAGDGTLRWSSGALSGRGGDWQRSVAALPVDEMVDDLAAAGVSALVVDRRAYDDEQPSPESQLDASVGPPTFESADGTRAWYDLRPRRAALVDRDGEIAVARRGAQVTRPVGVVVEGSPGARSTRDARSRDIGPAGAVVLTDEGVAAGRATPSPVTVSFTLQGEPGASVQLAPSGGPRRQVTLAEAPVEVLVQVELGADGVGRVGLRTDAAPLPSPADDWGDLRVRLADLLVRDARLGG